MKVPGEDLISCSGGVEHGITSYLQVVQIVTAIFKSETCKLSLTVLSAEFISLFTFTPLNFKIKAQFRRILFSYLLGSSLSVL